MGEEATVRVVRVTQVTQGSRQEHDMPSAHPGFMRCMEGAPRK